MTATAKKPRIITATVRRLREAARALKRAGWGGPPWASIPDHLVDDLRDWAAELDAYDARETRLDPSKRRRKTGKATRDKR